MTVADFAPHNMTANNAPSPYVASSSTAYSAFFYAYKAFDNVVGANQYWLANATTGWLQIYTGSSIYNLSNYSIRVNTIPEPNRALKNWTMQGSLDGTNWNILDTVAGEVSWGSGETRNFVCDAFGGYTYWRLNITLNNGDAGYVQVGELYLYGEPYSYTSYLKRGRSRLDLGGWSLG